MSVKLLTEHLLEFLSLKGGCTSSSKSTLVKMPQCWKSYDAAHIAFDGLEAHIPFPCRSFNFVLLLSLPMTVNRCPHFKNNDL